MNIGKAVLISISPKWCDLIKNGEKTVEIRKTYPNIGQNFKCYIYETLRGNGIGKVIGEFICCWIDSVSCYYSNPENRIAYRKQPYTAMTDRQMIDYLGNGKKGYGWHISELVIYDEPIDVYAFYSATTGKQLTRPPQSWCYVYKLEE